MAAGSIEASVAELATASNMVQKRPLGKSSGRALGPEASRLTYFVVAAL
jgi:hypothetical protein